VDLDQLHEVLGGSAVELAAPVARVDERAQADVGEIPGVAGGDLAVKMADDALGQVVALDEAVVQQLLQLGRAPNVRRSRA
jgi:hypothetical protein